MRFRVTTHGSRERYRPIVERARDYAIFTSDADQRVTNWNLGAEAITGYAASEIVGQLRQGTEDGRGILPSSVLNSNFH